MMTDPTANFLIQIKNGYMARKANIQADHSKFLENLSALLSKEGYIGKIEVKKNGKVKKDLLVELVYKDKKPAVNEIILVSKLGKRVYAGKNKIPRVLSGFGKVVISTSKGLMMGGTAHRDSLGGEIICKIW